MHPMDGIFSLSEAARTEFLRSLVHSFGCAYICLWQYDYHSSNRLFFLDGFYNNIINNQQPSSSLGTVAERLFNQYQLLTFDVHDDCVPGLAFRNHLPYLELQQSDLFGLASTEIQTQFFQEARIKTMVFMGCNKGEIELGFSNLSQVDIQTALKSLFADTTTMQNVVVSTTATSPRQQALADQVTPTPSQLIFPTIPESEHDAIIMRALLHVISSSPSQSHHQLNYQPHQNLPSVVLGVPGATAFKRYRGPHIYNNIGPNIASQNSRRQSLLKRSFSFFRSLYLRIMRQRIQATRFTSTQLHHMLSERRRRERLNENFQALRALLPPGTKKDKASILTAAKETLGSLVAKIEELNQRNQRLLAKEAAATQETIADWNVGVSHVPESSSSQERMVDLQVSVRGPSCQVDILKCLLEFLRQVQNVSLISAGAIANTHVAQGIALNQITFRLRIIEGSEWDDSAFQEAVTRVIADMIH